MENKYNDCFTRFKSKGFKSVEIPELIQDIFEILDKDGHCTIANFNLELESLGWGIEIVDDSIYKLINSI